MPRGKKFTADQIIGKLREAEVGLAQGKTVPEVVRKLGVPLPHAAPGPAPRLGS
jgi:putative transposase